MFEFDGILLKPCLLQPCFDVAGSLKLTTISTLVTYTTAHHTRAFAHGGVTGSSGKPAYREML